MFPDANTLKYSVRFSSNDYGLASKDAADITLAAESSRIASAKGTHS
jgi:hypothetical protein